MLMMFSVSVISSGIPLWRFAKCLIGALNRLWHECLSRVVSRSLCLVGITDDISWLLRLLETSLLLFPFVAACCSGAMAEAVQEPPCKTRDLASPKETFAALAKEYNFEDQLADAIVTAGCANLHDFRYLATKEEQLQTLVFDLAGDPGKVAVQKARCRRAWHGVKAALAGRAKLLPAVEEDLDQILPSEDLESLDQHFFARYHFLFPPNRMLSDVGVSRLAKELMRRSLALKDMQTVKNQLQQSSRTIKRRRVAGNLFTHEEEDEDVQMDGPLDASSVDGYLALLSIYLHGLAKAGCKPVAAPPALAEGLETLPEDYVVVPLSAVQMYLWRATDSSSKLPAKQRLTFPRAQDLAERSECAARFRVGTKSL